MNSDVWESGDNLLLGCKLGALLELKITNSSRQSKVTIDATKVNKASSSGNTGLLA